MSAPATSSVDEQKAMAEEQQLARMHGLVTMGVRGLRSGWDWEAWLRRAQPLVPIRFGNTMLVWAQRPRATMLLSEDGWQRHGRQVKPDERGIWVIDRAEHATARGDEQPTVVFDVSQTQGDPVALWTSRQRVQAAPARAWDALTSLALRQGFRVQRGDCAEGDALITWRDRRVHVRRDADETTAVTALAHQLGHVLLHADVPYLERRTPAFECGGTRKVEADSLAVLVAAHLGLAAPAITFPHVPSWAGHDARAHPAEVIHAVGERILRAAAKAFACLDAALDRPTPPSTAALNVRPARTSTQLSAGTRPASVVHRVVAPSTTPAGPVSAGSNDMAIRLQTAAERFYTGRLRGSWASVYLETHGLGEGVQQAWHIGCAPDGWTTLTGHLRDLGHTDADLEASGLAHRSSRGTLIDTFRDRAMFPVRTPDGTIAGFIGRAHPRAGDNVPKYLNSPGSDIYRKGDLLFGLHEARDTLTSGGLPVIVEGPLDAIAVTTACPGHYAGLAPCGTALTQRQIEILASVIDLRQTGVLIALDSDRAGQNAAVKAYGILRGFTDTITAVTLPTGQDPAGILETAGRTALANTLKAQRHPLADVVVDANIARWDRWLQFIEGRFNALRSTAPLIAEMPPTEIARQVARVAQRLDLSGGEVTAAVTDAISEAAANPRVRASPRSLNCGTIERSSPATRRTAASRAALDHPHSARDAMRSGIKSPAVRPLPRNRTAGASRLRPPNPRPR